MANEDSNLRIIKPRQAEYERAKSTRFSRFYVNNLASEESFTDEEQWCSRKQFFFQTTAFCMSLQNFWRFPREAYVRGQGAFVWLYMVCMVFLGSISLFFEVALGQYSNKTSARAFSLCPVFEGISISMALYCNVVSIYYNVINVHSFLYFFSSFNKTLEYSTCNNIPSDYCVEGTTNQTLTPEAAFFIYRIIHNTKEYAFAKPNAFTINGRNACILFFLWALLGIALLRGIRTLKWPSVLYCPLPFITFGAILLSALGINGAANGLNAMFSWKSEDFKNVLIWRHAMEQAFLSLGLGMGPMITFGSYSNYRTPADRDCLCITLIIMVISLMSGAILFCTAGILALERKQTIATVLQASGNYLNDLGVLVVFSQLFTRLSPAMGHLLSILFFFTLFSAGWLSLITYTEPVIVLLCTWFPVCEKHKIYTNLGVLVFSWCFGLIMVTPAGFSIMMLLDQRLVSITLVIIIICELCSVIYIYGIHEFSDDIDFIIGVDPNFIIKTVWIFAPILMLGSFSKFMIQTFSRKQRAYENITTLLCFIIALVPISSVAIYNSYQFYKEGNVRQVLISRDAPTRDSTNDSLPNAFSKSVPWFRKFGAVAGPSSAGQ